MQPKLYYGKLGLSDYLQHFISVFFCRMRCCFLSQSKRQRTSWCYCWMYINFCVKYVLFSSYVLFARSVCQLFGNLVFGLKIVADTAGYIHDEQMKRTNFFFVRATCFVAFSAFAQHIEFVMQIFSRKLARRRAFYHRCDGEPLQLHDENIRFSTNICNNSRSIWLVENAFSFAVCSPNSMVHDLPPAAFMST